MQKNHVIYQESNKKDICEIEFENYSLIHVFVAEGVCSIRFVPIENYCRKCFASDTL